MDSRKVEGRIKCTGGERGGGNDQDLLKSEGGVFRSLSYNN